MLLDAEVVIGDWNNGSPPWLDDISISFWDLVSCVSIRVSLGTWSLNYLYCLIRLSDIDMVIMLWLANLQFPLSSLVPTTGFESSSSTVTGFSFKFYGATAIGVVVYSNFVLKQIDHFVISNIVHSRIAIAIQLLQLIPLHYQPLQS